jgi:ribosomal protein S18 acetylase RimI-like enzyme
MKLISVHGIRTQNPWFRKLEESEELGRAKIDFKHFSYGYLSFVGFLNPFKRKQILDNFIKYYDTNIQKGERPNVIAHSFGTWIVTEAIKIYPSIRFNKVIFFGSILNPDTDLKVFFEGDQVRVLCHEVGEKDWVVPFSRFFLGGDAGESGKVGFSIIPQKFKKRILQTKYPRFTHSSASFFTKHINESWIPFLVSQPFNVKSSILRDDPLAWMNYKPLVEDISFPRKLFSCRVDRRGNYYGRYTLTVRNNDNQPLTYVPISISADGSEQVREMSFLPLDEGRRQLPYDILDDSFHCKKINVRIEPLRCGETNTLHYKFKISRTIVYSGDIDHFDIRNTQEISAEFHSFYRLVSPRYFTLNGGQLVCEIACREEKQADGTYKYCAVHVNQNHDEALIFYFEGCYQDNRLEKYAYPNFESFDLESGQYLLRNATESDLAKIEALELNVEGRENRACGGTIIERFRMFPDGFLVIEGDRGKIVGYVESLIWKHRDFETFEDIKDFPLHHDFSGKELYVIFLAVSEAFRKRGLATKLLSALNSVAKQYRVETISLVSKNHLEQFYEKRGFRSVKKLVNFLPSLASGGILMQKTVDA